jgi:putative ABC transport system permease protein
MLTDLLFRIRSLFGKEAAEASLEDELRFHREQQLEKHLQSGMTRDEAMRRFRIEFGGLDQTKEDCREARGVNLIETLLRDLRYALRTLRKSPGFTVVALLTLALGIGANTAMFSIVYGVLLRPLPYKDPSRLIVLNETTARVGRVSVSYPNFEDWRQQSRAFSQMAAVISVSFNLGAVSQPENITGEAVSPNYLSMIGVRPILGRDFDASEEKAGTEPVVLLSYPLWQSHFGGSSSAIGQTITLDGRRFTIVGVLPPDFRTLDKTDVVEPTGVWATNNSATNERGDRGDMVVAGRLAPGMSLAQARAEMEGIAAQLATAYPHTNAQCGVFLQPIRDVFVSDVRPAILVLFAAVIFVLLIACANIANLCLMRGASRTKEIALRLAIGASGGRIVGQMLAESFVLATLGGLLGLALAIGGMRGLSRLMPPSMLASEDMNLNGMVLLFTAGVVVLSAFLFGLAPALHSTKANVQSELKEGGRNTAGAGQNRWRGVLVIAEISLALILLVSAGLMMKSFYRLLSVDPGFVPDRVLTMYINLRTAQYDKDIAVLNFWQQVLERVRPLPGVESAALGTAIPLTDDHSRTDITIEGMPPAKPGGLPHPDVHVVSSAYVSTLGVPLLRGRTFSDEDTENAPHVGMINSALARRFFPNEDPVGKRFMFGRPSTDITKWVLVVGVLGDTKLYGLANPSRLEVYLPFRQSPRNDMSLVVKSKIDPAVLTSGIRGAIASIDRDQPVFGIATMKQLVGNSVATQRITLVLLGLFSALALVLAAIGIYGVISYSVAQRSHEIGIRMALGARRGDVMRMILAQGAKIAGIGVIIGIIASFCLTRLMTSLLFSVSAADPATFAGVAITLALVATLACYLPARRALRVDPIIALRCE